MLYNADTLICGHELLPPSSQLQQPTNIVSTRTSVQETPDHSPENANLLLKCTDGESSVRFICDGSLNQTQFACRKNHERTVAQIGVYENDQGSLVADFESTSGQHDTS